jgi:hypothetical protein
MEKIITSRVQVHLESQGLLNEGQHGFRSRHSCVTNLLIAREEWVEIKAEGADVDAVFIDFSKAFDKVPHRRLTQKLEANGIKGDVLEWIADFLRGRSFKVRVNGHYSKSREVLSGVPQGSALGPLLFIIYINDFLEVIQSPCLLYADDIKLWQISSRGEEVDLQKELNRLMQWSAAWQLPVNIGKCKYMHLGRGDNMGAFHLNGVLLDTTTGERDLGVIMQPNLKTASHTDRACASARGMLGAIRRSFHKLTPKAFQLLYASHVRSRLEYGGAAVYPCTKGEMNKIEKVQRAATRLVAGVSKLQYSERLKMLNLFPQCYRRQRGDLITVRRILRGDFGEQLRSKFKLRNADRRGHHLTLLKPSAGRLPAKYRLSRRAVNDWNSLPASVVEEGNDKCFKDRLDALMRDRWSQE